jgi:Ca2+-binding EF-hand superfamily protein
VFFLSPELSSAAVPRAPAMGAPIVVTFDEPPPLGITWTMHRPDDSQQMHAIIESIHPGTAAATKPELRVGLHLCAVGGTQVAGDEAPPEGLSLQQVTDMLRHAARPVTLTLTEPPRAGRSSAILEDVPLVKKQTRASARDFRSAVDDMMQSAGISREEARAALEARGFLFDPYAQDAASPDNTLQLGAQTHSKRAAGGGGIAACCSTPAKSAAHGLPAGAAMSTPPRGGRAAPSITFLDTPMPDTHSTPRPAEPVVAGATPGVERSLTRVFGQDRDLGLRLGSDDPLDQLWLQVDADGDGSLGREEVKKVMALMGRADVEANVDRVMQELDADNSGDIDIGEFEDWYGKQPDRSLVGSTTKCPVRIESCSGYATGRGLRKGMVVLSIQGKNVRDATLREVETLIKNASRPLKMEFGAMAVGSSAAGPVGPVTKKVVFGNAAQQLDLVLTSDDPLDQTWLKASQSGGTIGREEMITILKAMGRRNPGYIVTSVMNKIDSDGNGKIDIQEFERWYLQQEDRKLPHSDTKAPVRIDTVGKYGSERGLKPGLYILAVNGEDVRDSTLREVNSKIEAAGRPLTLEFEPSTFEIRVTIPRTTGAGYGMTLSSNTLRVVELTREPDGSPGPAELAGVKLDCTLMKIDGQPVRDLISVATLFTSAKGQSLECVFKNPGANMLQLRGGATRNSPSLMRNPSPVLQPEPTGKGLEDAPPPLPDWNDHAAAIPSIEETSFGAWLLLNGWGGESIVRFTLQVCGFIAELAAAGPASTWLESGFGWRAPFASLMLAAHLGAFLSGSSATLQLALAGAKMRSTDLPAEADVVKQAKSTISRTAGVTLAAVVLCVGLLAEPMVMSFITQSPELKWFDSAALSESGAAIMECARAVVAQDNAGETNPLMLSWQVHLGLAECFETALTASGEYQAVTFAVRLLALVQSACLIGWWVCSCYGSAQVYSLYAKWAQSRVEASRTKLTAALERIQSGWHRDENVDSLMHALRDLGQCGADGMAVLGVGSASPWPDAPSAAKLAEAIASGASSAVLWLVLMSVGMLSLCFTITVRANDSDVAIMEWALRIVVAEAALLAALYIVHASATLNSSIAAVDSALSSAQDDVTNVQQVLDAPPTEAAPTASAFHSRRGELQQVVTSTRMDAPTLSLKPRTDGVQPRGGSSAAAALGLKLAMVVLLGQALREATDALAANLAVAMQRQLKQLPPFLRDAVLPKLAAAGNGVMGGMQQAMEDADMAAAATVGATMSGAAAAEQNNPEVEAEVAVEAEAPSTEGSEEDAAVTAAAAAADATAETEAKAAGKADVNAEAETSKQKKKKKKKKRKKD